MNNVVTCPCCEESENDADEHVSECEHELTATEEEEILVDEGWECCEASAETGDEEEFEVWVCGNEFWEESDEEASEYVCKEGTYGIGTIEEGA